FNHPSQVFLLVKPAEDGSATAGFFFWDQRCIDSQFSYLEFPFEPRQLGGSAAPYEEPVPAEPERAPQEALTLPSLEELPLDAVTPRRAHWILYPLAAVLLLGLGAGGFWFYAKWSGPFIASVNSDSQALALQVERCGADLRVSWNRHAF